jgi:hypothetical protein
LSTSTPHGRDYIEGHHRTPLSHSDPTVTSHAEPASQRAGRGTTVRNAAVALLVYTSWSMVREGMRLPMKRTALADHVLVTDG